MPTDPKVIVTIPHSGTIPILNRRGPIMGNIPIPRSVAERLRSMGYRVTIKETLGPKPSTPKPKQALPEPPPEQPEPSEVDSVPSGTPEPPEPDADVDEGADGEDSPDIEIEIPEDLTKRKLIEWASEQCPDAELDMKMKKSEIVEAIREALS